VIGRLQTEGDVLEFVRAELRSQGHDQVRGLLNGTDAAANVPSLRSLGSGALQAMAGNKFAFGSVALTWAGAAGSAAATVTHGLSGTPTAVFATMDATANPLWAAVGNIGATTFQVKGWSPVAQTLTATAYWLVVA